MPTNLGRRQNVDPSQLVVYSKDIKIEERRSPNPSATAPYCIHMQIMNDGTASPLQDDNGSPQTVELIEAPPSPGMKMHKRKDLWEREESVDACQCEWVNS